MKSLSIVPSLFSRERLDKEARNLVVISKRRIRF